MLRQHRHNHARKAIWALLALSISVNFCSNNKISVCSKTFHGRPINTSKKWLTYCEPVKGNLATWIESMGLSHLLYPTDIRFYSAGSSQFSNRHYDVRLRFRGGHDDWSSFVDLIRKEGTSPLEEQLLFRSAHALSRPATDVHVGVSTESGILFSILLEGSALNVSTMQEETSLVTVASRLHDQDELAEKKAQIVGQTMPVPLTVKPKQTTTAAALDKIKNYFRARFKKDTLQELAAQSYYLHYLIEGVRGEVLGQGSGAWERLQISIIVVDLPHDELELRLFMDGHVAYGLVRPPSTAFTVSMEPQLAGQLQIYALSLLEDLRREVENGG